MYIISFSKHSGLPAWSVVLHLYMGYYHQEALFCPSSFCVRGPCRLRGLCVCDLRLHGLEDGALHGRRESAWLSEWNIFVHGGLSRRRLAALSSLYLNQNTFSARLGLPGFGKSSSVPSIEEKIPSSLGWHWPDGDRAECNSDFVQYVRIVKKKRMYREPRVLP